MAQLFTLMFGKSKKRMKPIMVDIIHKCENYKEIREKTKGSDCSRGWHQIVPAEAGAIPWRQKSATVGGNHCMNVKRVAKNGQTTGDAGYINKHGFNSHT